MISLYKACKQEALANFFDDIIFIEQLNNTVGLCLRRNDNKTRFVAFFLGIHQEPDQFMILHIDFNIVFVKNIKLGPENFLENGFRENNLGEKFDKADSEIFDKVEGSAEDISGLIFVLNELNILAYDLLIILVGLLIDEVSWVVPGKILWVESGIDGSLKI
jgi:hypothetical protein